jgi:hypothetical protein
MLVGRLDGLKVSESSVNSRLTLWRICDNDRGTSFGGESINTFKN